MALAMQMTTLLTSLPTRDLLWEISNLAVMKEMKVALKETTKSGFLVGGAVMLSGLFAGPPGILIGGVAGSCLAAYLAQNKFKTVPEIFNEDLTDEQKEKLADELRKCLTAQNIFTIVELGLRLQNNDLLMEAIVQIVRQFITSDLALKLM
ncbi:protein C19orf12 homolog [Leptopilina heterotoma]|uniref:protein C19orf12 homolog n=1 Tax=Leptopilina heterotoma TaxID=63436 RepID=UPI001CAA3211|nr:protein C19orf12 homolog [Leptopilina heterotoma]